MFNCLTGTRTFSNGCWRSVEWVLTNGIINISKVFGMITDVMLRTLLQE